MVLAKTSQNVTLFVFTIMLLATPILLQAQSNSNSSTTKVEDENSKDSPEEISFGAVISVSRSKSLIDHQDGTLKESADLILNPTAQFFGNNFSLKSAYSRDLRDSQATDWSDTSISISREITNWQTKNQSSKLQRSQKTWSLSLLSSLPTSKISSIKQSMLGALGIGTSLVFLPSDTNFGLSASLGLSFSKLFHRFDTASDGAVNNTAASNQSLALGFQLGSFSISGEFVHKLRWTYQGANKSSFEHTEELGYSLNPHFQIALGHSNAGMAQKITGENNIQLIDENESIIYSSLTMSY